MSKTFKDLTAQWLHQSPSLRGALARGIRFADETSVSDVVSQDFPATALEAAWRVVADAFQVLRAQHLPPNRLTWIYERAALHCVQRSDGAILGVFVRKRATETDPAELDQLLTDFQSLVPPPI